MVAAPIWVAGAGPGGLATAALLRRQGRDVVVVERAAGLREGGGALVLWPHGTRALAEVLGADVLAALGPQYRRARVCRWDGSVSHDLPVGRLADGGGGWVMAVERGALMRALGAALPGAPVRFGVELVGADVRADGVGVRFADGGEAHAAALVGADGFGSAVGRALWGERPARPAGVVAWIGASAHPARDARVVTATEGQGRRFLHLPHAQGAWWYAYTHTSLAAQSHADLRRAFRGFHPPVVDVIDATPDDACLRFELRDRPASADWGRGAATLLGDAAHACTPDLGQGVCMAAEDAVVLARALAAEPSIDAAFRRYEGLRRPRTADLQGASWRVSQAGFAASPLGAQLRDAAFRAAPDVGLMAGFAAMFHDVAGAPRPS